MPKKNIESQPSPEDDGEKVLGSENINDWEQDEKGVFKLKEEVRTAQLEEEKNPEKLESLYEEIEEKFRKEESGSEEEKESEVENTEEETIEDRIQNANSFDELVDILKTMEKGSGIQLHPKGPDGPRWNVGWFFGGKFGGEPVSSIISHIDEIERTITHLSDNKLEYAYSDNHHVHANMDYIPEEGGLKDKVKELLERQQKIDEEKLPKKEEEDVNPERLKSLAEKGEKKTREIVELLESVNSLVAKVSEKYLDLKKWEFLLNYPDDEKDAFLKDVRPKIKKMVSQQLMKIEQENAALKKQLERTLKELEENGFGSIVDNVRLSISVLEK